MAESPTLRCYKGTYNYFVPCLSKNLYYSNTKKLDIFASAQFLLYWPSMS